MAFWASIIKGFDQSSDLLQTSKSGESNGKSGLRQVTSAISDAQVTSATRFFKNLAWITLPASSPSKTTAYSVSV